MNNAINLSIISNEEIEREIKRNQVNKLRNLIVALVMIMGFAFNPVTVKANANKDLSIATTYISRNYPGYKVKFCSEGKPNTLRLRTRKGKRIVYVEVLRSTCKGNLKNRAGSWGATKKYHSYITYNKRVKRGKTVKSYCIYNPNSNYTDDVVAVIDSGMIR